MNEYYDSNSSDEDCGGLLRKALDVDLPDDFNPNSIPQTGEEYLHHVIYERTKCKAWVTADVDRNKFKDKQTFKLNLEEEPITKPNTKFLPTAEWQKEKVSDFNEFRSFIEGQIQAEGQNTTFNEDIFLEKIIKESPLFSDVIEYAQCSKIRMIQIIAKYIGTLENELNVNVGTWLYAILALLDKPLSPSSCHTLRDLARKCSLVRSRLSKDASIEVYSPYNLYICLISRYFNQLDLADPY